MDKYKTLIDCLCKVARKKCAEDENTIMEAIAEATRLANAPQSTGAVLDAFSTAKSKALQEFVEYVHMFGEIKCAPTLKDSDGLYKSEATIKYIPDDVYYGKVNVVWISRSGCLMDRNIRDFSFDELMSMLETVK